MFTENIYVFLAKLESTEELGVLQKFQLIFGRYTFYRFEKNWCFGS